MIHLLYTALQRSKAAIISNRFMIPGFLATVFLMSCNRMLVYQPQTQPQNIDGELIFLGQIHYPDIPYFLDDWKEAHKQAKEQVDDRVVEQFKRIERPIHVKLFVGTWCSDSRDGIPLFIETLERAQNPNIQMEIIGVDRRKIDPENMAPQFEIYRVPTFVVMENGKELGRMIEIPFTTFPEDFLEIVGSLPDQI